MNTRIRKLAAALVALGLAGAGSGAPGAAQAPFEFVVLGDIPYGEDQAGNLGYIGSRMRSGGYPFAIHYGDLKSGDGACSDTLLRDRQALLAGLIPGGLFYTPGDNDWTDCDRPGAGGFDELERLVFLKSLFFAGAQPANPAWSVQGQAPDYTENLRWSAGGLTFATLHIVGSDNGRAEILKSDPEEALDAVDARDAANLDWLAGSFEAARERGSEGLVVAMQADPGELNHPDARGLACGHDERTACNPYLDFLESLTEQAAGFGKPVLLVHGSTNSYCLDRGYGGWRAPNLWRLNGPGDFVTVDAAVVRFDARARLPFEVWGVLSGDPPIDCALRGR